MNTIEVNRINDINIDDHFIFDGTYPSLAVDSEIIYMLMKKLQKQNSELNEKLRLAELLINKIDSKEYEQMIGTYKLLTKQHNRG